MDEAKVHEREFSRVFGNVEEETDKGTLSRELAVAAEDVAIAAPYRFCFLYFIHH